MKKILSLVVLGLLWCNIGVAEKYPLLTISQIKLIHLDEMRSYIINTYVDGSCDFKVKNRWDNRYGKFYQNCSWTQDGRIFEIQFNERFMVHLGKVNDSNSSISGSWHSKGGDTKGLFEGYISSGEFQESEPSPEDKKVVAASSGSGFFVSSSGHIVTNYHVIEACDSIKTYYAGSEKEAKVLFIDKTNDLAIIKANLKPDKVYAVSDEDVSLLEDVIVAGYPLGKKISAAIKTSKGSVTALAGYGDNYSNFQIDAPLNTGNSGGPIMNQKGNIVGVAVATYGKESGVESFNFGVKSSTLKTFANSNNFKFTPASQDELSNKDLGKLITEATIYLECWMSVAKIKQLIAEEESRKAFFSEYK